MLEPNKAHPPRQHSVLHAKVSLARIGAEVDNAVMIARNQCYRIGHPRCCSRLDASLHTQKQWMPTRFTTVGWRRRFRSAPIRGVLLVAVCWLRAASPNCEKSSRRSSLCFRT